MYITLLLELTTKIVSVLQIFTCNNNQISVDVEI